MTADLVALLESAPSAQHVVPGSPAELWADSDAYARLAEDLLDASTALGRIETSSWTGVAAEAFARSRDDLLARLRTAAECYAAAAASLGEHASVLRWAQAEAADAIGEFRRGAVCQAQRNLATPELTPQQTAAIDRVSDARIAVHRSGRTAADSLDEAISRAPRPGGFWNDAGKAWSGFWHGAAESTEGILKLGWSESPGYLLAHPGAWWKANVALASGLWNDVQHPRVLGKSIVDWDTWARDPARAAGHLVPDVALMLATAGMGAAAAKGATTTATVAAKVTAEGAAAGAAGEGAAASADALDVIESRVVRDLDDLTSLRGATPDEVRELVPDTWTEKPLKKGDGVRFLNPKRPGESVSLEDGWPGHPDPLHSGPYVKISRDGVIERIPLRGNPVLGK